MMPAAKSCHLFGHNPHNEPDGGPHPGPHDTVALVTDLTTSGNALLEAIANTAASGANIAFAFTVIEHGPAARRALERRRQRLLSLHQVP